MKVRIHEISEGKRKFRAVATVNDDMRIKYVFGKEKTRFLEKDEDGRPTNLLNKFIELYERRVEEQRLSGQDVSDMERKTYEV